MSNKTALGNEFEDNNSSRVNLPTILLFPIDFWVTLHNLYCQVHNTAYQYHGFTFCDINYLRQVQQSIQGTQND